jgi:hypothetical protein
MTGHFGEAQRRGVIACASECSHDPSDPAAGSSSTAVVPGRSVAARPRELLIELFAALTGVDEIGDAFEEELDMRPRGHAQVVSGDGLQEDAGLPANVTKGHLMVTVLATRPSPLVVEPILGRRPER